MDQRLLKETFIARRRSVFLIIFLLIINIISFIYLWGYQEPQLAALQSSWFEKRQKHSESNVVNIAAIYAQGTKDLQVWNSRILPKKDFVRLVEELFELAGNNSLTVKSVTYKPEKIKEEGEIKQEKLLTYAIDFTVSGNYAGVKSLISDLMRSPHIILLDNLSLKNSSQTKEDVELKLGLITYFRVEGQ